MSFDRLNEFEPLAGSVGPFAAPDLLETMWRHTAAPGEELLVASDDVGAVALVRGSNTLAMVGPQNLVDYRSSVGDATAALAEVLRSVPPGTSFRFDSLPMEASDEMARAVALAGLESQVSSHDATAVLNLPATFDDYLANIGKKERHETKRKLRRFEEAHGRPRVVTYTHGGPILDRFFRLHRLGEPPKSDFMTAPMRALFTDLITNSGWQIDALYGDGPRCFALALSFVDENGYYLYNSTIDPTARESSPGVVLLTRLIEDQIAIMGGEKESRVFDFLKGDEQYKYRLGAQARPLYVVEGVT